MTTVETFVPLDETDVAAFGLDVNEFENGEAPLNSTLVVVGVAFVLIGVFC